VRARQLGSRCGAAARALLTRCPGLLSAALLFLRHAATKPPRPWPCSCATCEACSPTSCAPLPASLATRRTWGSCR
jgi:hypothetical protein